MNTDQFSSREALATVSNKENKIFTHKFIFYETYMLVSTEIAAQRAKKGTK